MAARRQEAASKHNVCIIPFGGGTSVSQALLCPVDELRMIVSLDMTLMNRILWIDHDNMTMKVEAGAIGKQLETELNGKGYRLGTNGGGSGMRACARVSGLTARSSCCFLCRCQPMPRS